MFKTLLCEGMFCANNVKFILIASVVTVNISILFNLPLLNVWWYIVVYEFII